MKTRLSRTTGEEQADLAMEPTTDSYDPLSPVPRLTIPHHSSGWGGSMAREFLVLLSDMFCPPVPPGPESGPSDPWFDYLADYAQVDSEVRTCYAMWSGLLHVEEADRKAEVTDLRDMVRTVVQARREIVDVLQRDVKRQAHVMQTLIRAANSGTDDVPAKQAVGS